MKIYLNLLPEEQKEETKKRKIYKNLLHQEIRLFFPLALFIAMLAAVNFNLNIQYESLQLATELKDTREESQKLKKFEESFKEANARLSLLSSVKEKSIHWSGPLIELERAVPEGIYLTSLVTSDYSVKITGKAKNRDELRSFQDKIKNSECFEMEEVPLQNLVVGDDSPFELEFKVKKDCLRKG